jgi:hypothetical protein
VPEIVWLIRRPCQRAISGTPLHPGHDISYISVISSPGQFGFVSENFLIPSAWTLPHGNPDGIGGSRTLPSIHATTPENALQRFPFALAHGTRSVGLVKAAFSRTG